MKQIIIHMR